MLEPSISGFAGVLLFILAAIVVAGGGLLTSWIIRPKRPNIHKDTTYESGEDPEGSAWKNFNVRFYIVALIFILFEVEIIFLFPWATIFADQEKLAINPSWSVLTLIEMAIFVLLLLLGLAYVWKKGYLDWVKPKPKDTSYKGKIPQSEYEKINQKYK